MNRAPVHFLAASKTISDYLSFLFLPFVSPPFCFCYSCLLPAVIFPALFSLCFCPCPCPVRAPSWGSAILLPRTRSLPPPGGSSELEIDEPRGWGVCGVGSKQADGQKDCGASRRASQGSGQRRWVICSTKRPGTEWVLTKKLGGI